MHLFFFNINIVEASSSSLVMSMFKLTLIVVCLILKDVNECDTGNNTCTTAQVCFNFQGSYTCLNPLQCNLPYIEVSDK